MEGMAGGLPDTWNCMNKAGECMALHVLQLFEEQGVVQIFRCLNMSADKRSLLLKEGLRCLYCLYQVVCT